MKKLGAIALCVLMSVPCVFAQGAGVMPFTRIDRNPVTSAFAGAGSASMETTAWSAFSNASVLPFSGKTLDASLSYQFWAPSAAGGSHVNAAVSYMVAPRVGVALGYAAQLGAWTETLDALGRPVGSSAPGGHLIALGAGIGLGDKLSLGVNGRYAIEALTAEDHVSALSVDAFLTLQPMETLRFTAGVSTLGPKVAGASQPSSVKAGADWNMAFADVHSLEVMADADYFFGGGVSAAAGLQYAFNNMAFLRAGYRFSTAYCPIPSHLGVGVGVKLSGFRLDISWLTASSYLGNTICAGLGYSF